MTFSLFLVVALIVQTHGFFLFQTDGRNARFVFVAVIHNDGLGDASGTFRTYELVKRSFPKATYVMFIADRHKDGRGKAHMKSLSESVEGVDAEFFTSEDKLMTRCQKDFMSNSKLKQDTIYIVGPYAGSSLPAGHKQKVLNVMEIGLTKNSFGFQRDQMGLPLPPKDVKSQLLKTPFQNVALKNLFKDPENLPVFTYSSSDIILNSFWNVFKPLKFTTGNTLNIILVGPKEIPIEVSFNHYCADKTVTLSWIDVATQKVLDTPCDGGKNTIKVHMFTSLSPTDFKKAMLMSEPIVAVTGDQSLLEAIAFKKIPIIDNKKSMSKNTFRENFLERVDPKSEITKFVVTLQDYLGKSTYMSPTELPKPPLLTREKMTSMVKEMKKIYLPEARGKLNTEKILRQKIISLLKKPRANSISGTLKRTSSSKQSKKAVGVTKKPLRLKSVRGLTSLSSKKSKPIL